jgi:hypothetical protein
MRHAFTVLVVVSVVGTGGQQWKLAIALRDGPPAPGREAAVYDARFIVIVCMPADEHDRALERRLLRRPSFPEWVGPRTR